MTISFLLTCHNRKEKTLLCLERLYSQKYVAEINVEVFLVDDGSTDGTGESVKRDFPLVHVINGNGSLFWNRGMLLAWQHALVESDCEYAIWLNDDTMLFPSALNIIMKCVVNHPNSIIVGTVSDKEGKVSYGGYQIKNVLLKPENKELPCVLFNGNVVLVPRTVSDKIGLLDNHFSHAMGDFEYGRRANRYGISTFATPIIGQCDRNGEYVRWMDVKYSVWTRLKMLYSPLGENPFEVFYYEKSESLPRALFLFCYLNLKAVFPRLLKNRST